MEAIRIEILNPFITIVVFFLFISCQISFYLVPVVFTFYYFSI